MAELSDEEVFGSTSVPKEMSDSEVFGAAPAPTASMRQDQGELSDSEVFGAAPTPAPAPVAESTPLTEYGKEAGKSFVAQGINTLVSAPLVGAAGRASGPALPPSAVMSPLEQGLAEEDQRNFANTLAPVQENPLYKAGKYVEGKTQEYLGPSPGWEGSWTTDIAGGFGSVGGAVLGSFLSPGATALSLVNSGSGEAVDNAIKAGATQEQIRQAAKFGGVAGATDLVDMLLPQLGTPGKVAGLIQRVGVRALKGAAAEGGQEGLQQFIQNLISKGIYDPNKDLREDVSRSALIGAIVGGGVSSVAGGHGKAPTPATEGDVNAAYSTLVSTPVPQAPPLDATTQPDPPPVTPTEQPSVVQPEAVVPPPAAAAVAPGESPLEQLLNNPPANPTEAHIQESAPFDAGANSQVAELAPIIAPNLAEPSLTKERTSLDSTEEALKAISEVLGSTEEQTTPVKPNAELDINSMQKVGEQMGSNPGGIYQDSQGKKYYVKQGQSPEHVKNELLAAALYKLAGVPTLNYVPAGPNHVATELVPLDKNNASQLGDMEKFLAQRDFAAHAWLANWDVVGQGGDNIGVVDGKVIPLDLGGALEFRAQGAPKGAAFGNEVGELVSLKNFLTNPDSAKLFGAATNVKTSASRVTSISNQAIKDTVLAHGGSIQLVNKLINRKNDIEKKVFGDRKPPKTFDQAIENTEFKLVDPAAPKELSEVEVFEDKKVVETTPDEWLDALIETGESKKVSIEDLIELPTQELLDELKKPTKNVYDFLKSKELVELAAAAKYPDPVQAREAILKHNRSLAQAYKKQKKAVFAKRVSATAKKWKLFHGTHASEFEKFNDPSGKNSERGIFFTPDLQFAKQFSGGNTVYEVEVTPGKTRVVDLAKMITNKKFMERNAKENPHLVTTAKNHQEFVKSNITDYKKDIKTFEAKYGVPKVLQTPKTNYSWGGIHTAIEMAREDGLDTVVLRNINELGGHDQIVVLNPNRVFNLKTKKMMFRNSVAPPKYNTSKIVPSAKPKIASLQDDVLKLLQQVATMAKNAQIAKLIVQQTVGEDAAQRVATPKTITTSGFDEQWGGEVAMEASGMYSPQAEMDQTIPLIHVAVSGPQEQAIVSTFHESWHAIEGTLTGEEVAILRAETENLRNFVKAMNPEQAALYDRAQAEEIWAEAAAFYSTGRLQQEAKIRLGPAAMVLEKIAQLLRFVRQIAAKYGFTRSGDIFEKFYEGEMKERRAGMPVDMLERWWAQETGYTLDPSSSEAQEVATNTAANEASFKSVDKGISNVPGTVETLKLHKGVKNLYSMFHGTTAVPPPVQQAVAAADVIARRHKWWWGLDRLVDLNPRFTPLLRYAELTRLMRTDAAKIHDRAEGVAKAWRKLGKQAENLGQLIDYVANMNYRTPQEVAQGITRHPTPQEFNAAVSQFKVGSDALAVFQRQKKFFEGFLQLTVQNAIAEAQRTIVSNPVALMNKITAIQAKQQALLSKPYFPFLRFGRHYVQIKDATGKLVHFETFERKGLRSAESVQLAAEKYYQGQVPQGYIVTHGLLSESAQPFIGLPPELLESIQNELMQMPGTSGQAPGLTQAQLDAIEQLRFAAAPASSFVKRFQNKDYVPGYSDDFLRAFSRYAFNGGRYYARTRYGWELRKQIADAEKLGKQSSDNRIGALVSYMSDHLYHTVLDTSKDWALVKGAAFLWYLGFSPAAATMNLSQVPLITYPWLSTNFGGAGFGNARAAKALAKASTDLKNFYKKGSYQNQSAFAMRALNYGVETGRISETQAHELAGLAQGSTLLGIANSRTRLWMTKFAEVGAWMFETAEQWNRRVTFRAALDLAVKYPNSKAVTQALNKYANEYAQLIQSGTFSQSEAAAVITAVHATEQTQFVYAKENRPRVMQGGLRGTIGVFQTYLLNYLQVIGADKKGMLPQHLFVAMAMYGLMGLPGAEDIEDILTVLGKWLFGKDFSVERKLREFLTELAGDKADVVLHGLARRGWGLPAIADMLGERPRGLTPPTFVEPGPDGKYPAGSGHSSLIPLPVLDRSKAGSQGQILPFKIGEILDPLDTDKVISQQTQQASGAVFGVGFNLFRSMFDQSTSATDFKRWERAMPRALASASSAYRAFSEGRERGKGGPNAAPTIVPYDTHDTEQMAEIFAKALGYTPLRQSAKWDQIIAQQEIIKRLEIEQKLILSNRFEAHMGQKPEEIERANKAIQDYNESLPDYAQGYKITSDSWAASKETRERDRNAKESGIPGQRRQRPVADYIQSLFPESTVDVRRVK